MPWEPDGYFDRKARADQDAKPCADEGRAHRLEARRFYRAAPPYRIQFEINGTVSLCQKHYQYWEHLFPEGATEWLPISQHADLEEAERRLRHICGPMIYYDEEGRMTRAPGRAKPAWNMPPDDDEG
ncbi:hypothetical protein ACFQY5_35920 [Paeniroseomonas aquatica]|uniref:Uncharacterized protein n=1 Tax=Paeniroseomonas aquatica TaxID=373043 RepID=A0ABT8AG60_9PROT|nr:hypothetical protein [Paeniroseomonas aquatica]MDN3568725.1 hypothetical protein [Paeniroseomonas aquatica]